jgi:hypothetical protein
MTSSRRSTERQNPLTNAGLKPKTQPSTQEPKEALQPEASSVANGQEQEERRGGRPLKDDEEKATEKVTAYFTPQQYDKIDELRKAHRKRTGKRISVNVLLRRLVEVATIEDILLK